MHGVQKQKFKKFKDNRSKKYKREKQKLKGMR